MKRRKPPQDEPAPRYRKGNLPVKPCAACGRPMEWRRRWAKIWDEVRYCSDRCRHSKNKP